MRRTAALLFLLLALPLTAAAESFKTTDGVTLHYRVVGKGEPLVLLSGGPGFSPDYLMPIAERLSKHYACILFEQRGTGRSVVTSYADENFVPSLLVADLESLRVKLGLEKLTLVGHSWGGILSQLYAAGHPERVKALVLLNAGGPTLAFAVDFQKNLAARTTDEDKKKIAEAEAKRAEAPKQAVLGITRARTPSYFHDRAKAQRLMDSMDESSMDAAVIMPIFRGLMATGYDVREPMKKLEVPVLIVHGRQDPLTTAEELKATFPKAKFVWIEDAGHFPWEEQPKPFFEAVEGFLKTAS